MRRRRTADTFEETARVVVPVEHCTGTGWEVGTAGLVGSGGGRASGCCPFFGSGWVAGERLGDGLLIDWGGIAGGVR